MTPLDILDGPHGGQELLGRCGSAPYPRISGAPQPGEGAEARARLRPRPQFGTTGSVIREGRLRAWKIRWRAPRMVVPSVTGSPVLRLRSQRGKLLEVT